MLLFPDLSYDDARPKGLLRDRRDLEEAIVHGAVKRVRVRTGRVAVPVPGCTSMQNLHDHHIRFRSAGGSDEPANRVTLCAFHHLRGVHAERLRCVGRAPDELTWEMGIRPGAAPLAAYRSGTFN